MTTSYIGGSCTTTTAPVSFTSNATYVTPYTVVSDGTIVSACFRVNNPGTVNGHITLIMLRPNGTNWDYVGESPSIEVTTSETVTTSCNISVKAGDRVGWYADSNCSVDCMDNTGPYNYYSAIGKQTGTNFSLPDSVYYDFGDAGVVVTYSDVSTYTHILEIRIRPWGWYTPDGAASDLLLKMNDINGWCLNLITGLTDWQYIKSDIITDGSDVLIQCKFKNLSVTSTSLSMKPLVVQLGAIIENIFMLIGYLVIITVMVGFISGWKFFGIFEPSDSPDSKEKAPTYVPPPEEQLPGIKEAVDDSGNNCLTGLPSNPTCTDLNNYAICLDSVHIGVYGTLKSVYPSFIEFQTTYNEYLNKYVGLVSSCNPDIPGSTSSDIQQKINETQQDYIKELEDDFEKLQDLYESSLCCIELPYIGCIISKELCDTAKTAAYVVVGGAIIYLGYNIYTSMQPPKKQ